MGKLRDARVLVAGAVVLAFVLGLLVRDAIQGPHPDDVVEVLVGDWSDGEVSYLRDVVAHYTDAHVEVRAQEDIETVLADRLEAGNPPDVAIVARPGLVRRYASQGWLEPVDQQVTSRVREAWNQLVTVRSGDGPSRVYGAWVKAAHKSLFWYRPEALHNEAYESWTWTDLADWVEGRAADDAAIGAPLAVAAQSQWPLTDWFENLLAARDPDLYDRLASGETTSWDHPAVHSVLESLADLWATPGALTGGPEAALETRWNDLPNLLRDGRAAVAFGPSFMAGPVEDLPAAGRPTAFGFPGEEGDNPLVVGGDIAVVPEGSDEGERLVEWLTDAEAIQLWSQDPGYLSPSRLSPYGPDGASEDDLRRYLTQPFLDRERPLHFDLSDELGAAQGGVGREMWDIFSQFFEEVTDGGSDRGCAIERVVDRLGALSRGETPPDVECGG